VRVLVIGAGSIGRRHIGNLLALGCEVFVWDISPAAQEAAFLIGARRKALQNRPPDAVVIATPWDQHAHSVEWALSQCPQSHLFIEKPLGSATQIERWQGIGAECDRRDLVTQVGYMLRFHPAAAGLRSVPSPILGRFACHADMRTWPGSSYGPSLLELSHEIDLALHCGAPSSRVSVDVADEHRHVFSLCGSGLRWRLELDGQAKRYERRWAVVSESMSVDVSIGRSDALGDAMYRAEMAHFLNAARTGKQSEPAATLADGIRVLDVCAMVEAQVGAHA
jgi:predicted dehydrogenase